MSKQNFASPKSSAFELSQNLNENIKFQSFLVINEKGENLGVLKKEEALKIAKANNLDLFCINPYSSQPVCKITDFSKHLYRRKKTVEKRPKKKTSSLKEAKFSFRIGENDLLIKVNKIVKWLSEDDVVKVILVMWGREQKHKDLALDKCKNIIKRVQDFSSQFQLKDDIKLVSNMYVFTFFRNKKVSDKNNEKK